MRISVFILKDTTLLDKQVRVATRTLENKGVNPKEALEQAQKSVSDIQCSYTVVTNSREINPKDIINDIVGDKRYRTRISY